MITGLSRQFEIIYNSQILRWMALNLLGSEAAVGCEFDVITAPVIAKACNEEGIPTASFGLYQIKNNLGEDEREVAIKLILGNIENLYLTGQRGWTDKYTEELAEIEAARGRPAREIHSHADICLELHPERYCKPEVR